MSGSGSHQKQHLQPDEDGTDSEGNGNSGDASDESDASDDTTSSNPFIAKKSRYCVNAFVLCTDPDCLLVFKRERRWGRVT